MANDLWILVGFGPVVCAGSAVAFAEGRRAWRTAARVAFTRPDTNGPAGVLEVEGAERQLGMLLRRMRAYRRAPYNFASSRISNDAEFERCVDLATVLGLRIGELSGASIGAPRERERMRDQILQSLWPRSASWAALRHRTDRANGGRAEAALTAGETSTKHPKS